MSRGKGVGFLQAIDLAAQPRDGAEKRVMRGERLYPSSQWPQR